MLLFVSVPSSFQMFLFSHNYLLLGVRPLYEPCCVQQAYSCLLSTSPNTHTINSLLWFSLSPGNIYPVSKNQGYSPKSILQYLTIYQYCLFVFEGRGCSHLWNTLPYVGHCIRYFVSINSLNQKGKSVGGYQQMQQQQQQTKLQMIWICMCQPFCFKSGMKSLDQPSWLILGYTFPIENSTEATDTTPGERLIVIKLCV